jgi:hypothetical protein
MNQVFPFSVSPPSPLSWRGIAPSSECGGISPRRVARSRTDIFGLLFSFCLQVSSTPSERGLIAPTGVFFIEPCPEFVLASTVAPQRHGCVSAVLWVCSVACVVSAISLAVEIATGYCLDSIEQSIIAVVTISTHPVLLVLVFLIQGLSLSLYIIYHNPVTVSTTILIIFRFLFSGHPWPTNSGREGKEECPGTAHNSRFTKCKNTHFAKRQTL